MRDVIYENVSQYTFGLSTSAQYSQLSIVSGKGVYLEDVVGHTYLDVHAGPAVMSTGHGHPVFLDAMIDQLQRLVHCHDLPSPSRLEFQNRLQMFVGMGWKIAMLSSGAEAIELALRVARGYTGRDDIIVFSGAFHGKTLGALSCTDPVFRKGWQHRSSHTYRIPYNSTEKAIAELDRFPGPAAVLIEPVQGSAGNIQPPHDFLDRIFAYCRSREILVIADEILTGCGRTGTFLATENLLTKPDIITLGKGIGSGYPLTVVLINETLASSPTVDIVGNSSTSHSGNPLAAAAGAATLKIISEEALVENSCQVGALFLEELHNLAARWPFMRNVRGRGLMLGFDLALNKNGGKDLFKACLRNGLMIMGLSNRIRINPPLIFKPTHVEEAVMKLDRALAEVSK